MTKYSIKDNDDIKFLLVYIRKMQNTINVEILAIDKMVLLTEIVVDRKESNVSIKKVSVI